MTHRYKFTSLLGMLFGLTLMVSCSKKEQSENTIVPSVWDQVPAILESIQKPSFPDQTFVISDFGAVGDGSTDASQAIKSAIQACAEAGGGKVVVPPGDYPTGPIYLESNVNLHL